MNRLPSAAACNLCFLGEHGAGAIGDAGRGRNSQLRREKKLFQKRAISISCSIFIIKFA